MGANNSLQLHWKHHAFKINNALKQSNSFTSLRGLKMNGRQNLRIWCIRLLNFVVWGVHSFFPSSYDNMIFYSFFANYSVTVPSYGNKAFLIKNWIYRWIDVDVESLQTLRYRSLAVTAKCVWVGGHHVRLKPQYQPDQGTETTNLSYITQIFGTAAVSFFSWAGWQCQRSSLVDHETF